LLKKKFFIIIIIIIYLNKKKKRKETKLQKSTKTKKGHRTPHLPTSTGSSEIGDHQPHTVTDHNVAYKLTSGIGSLC